MADIDRLQNTMQRLRQQRTAGTPARDEKRQIREVLDGLKTHYETYRAQMQGSPVGVPVDHKHLDFLTSYASNALKDAQAVALRIEHGASSRSRGRSAPLDVLPFHVVLLDANDRTSFEQDLAIINSLLQSHTLPLPASDAETLLDKAFHLGALNRKSGETLDALIANPNIPNDPVRFERRRESINTFQSALDAAVTAAIAGSGPAQATPRSQPVDDHHSLYDAPPRVVPTARARFPAVGRNSSASQPGSVQNWLDTTDFSYDDGGAPRPVPLETATDNRVVASVPQQQRPEGAPGVVRKRTFRSPIQPSWMRRGNAPSDVSSLSDSDERDRR